jgi:hypothetical protein
LADGSLGFILAATAGVRPLLLPLADSPGIEDDCVDLFKTKLAGRLISLDTANNNEQLREQLLQLAASKLVNLRAIDVIGIAEEVLPMYLPASWQNQLCIDINSDSTELEHVSVEWVLKLWKVIGAAENKQVTSNAVASEVDLISGLKTLAIWPLIPAEKQKYPVFAAPTPSAGLLEEGAFTEAATSALAKLGCAFVSLSVIKKLPKMVTRSQCIHHATGLGVLTALLHVFKAKRGSVATAFGGVDNAGGLIETDIVLLSEEKDALRAFLLQPRWFEGETLEPELATQLSLLPIYRCCTRNNNNTSSTFSSPTSRVSFTELGNGEKYLIPDGFTGYGALSSDFIYSSSPGEAMVLVKVT